ncbi:MAG: hypothetical protein WCH34_02135 [Bacteroidota bacterium]
MKNTYISGILILVILYFSSCANPEKKQHLAKLDSLIVILDTASAQLSIFDKADIKARYNTYVKNFTQINNNFTWDIKDSGWSKILNYANMSKTLKKNFSKAAELKSQIAESKTQLKNLAHDIESGSIEKVKQVEYLQTEEDVVKCLAMSVMLKTEQVQQLLTRHDSLAPLIEKLILNPPKTKKSTKAFIPKDEDD